MCVDLNDIAKGRVLVLNPRHLPNTTEIGAYQGISPLGGDSPHYFLCVGKEEDHSYWCPLSSRKKPNGKGSDDGQGVIPNESKAGFPHFMSSETWYDTKQVWKIPNDAVIAAANHEQSNRRGASFNHVASTFVDSIFKGAGDLW